MKETFERGMAIHGLEPSTVWDLSHDHELLASCSSHIQDVVEDVAGTSWSATLSSRIGRFGVSAPITVEIEEELPSQRMVVRLSGEDRAVGTRLAVHIVAELDHAGNSVTVRMHGAYEVAGKVANLGSALVKKQASSMIDEFWINFGAEMKKQGADRVDSPLVRETSA